ncbi:DUF2382 domain-containing protein [Nitrospira sp. Nam74]
MGGKLQRDVRIQADQEESGMTVSKDIDTAGASPDRKPSDETVVPVVQEKLHVDTQRVETGRVRLTKTVHEREVVVEEPSVQEEVQIERVPVNRFVAEPVGVRYEGDTTIIPVIEEVVVVETRLRLKEEVRVTKRQITTPFSQPVRLRTEEVAVERLPPRRNGPGTEEGSP